MTNPTPQTLPDMRKTFEATIARLWPGKDLSIGPDGCYTIWRTENDWLLWQAALAAQPPAVAAPIHWRAVLDPEQQPQQPKDSLHVVGFRYERAAESWIAEQLDFGGWRYTLEPLYGAAQPPAAAPMADTSHLNCLQAREISRAYAICEPCNTGNPAACLYLKPKPPAVAAIPEPSDDEVDLLLAEIDQIARDHDSEYYGLPTWEESRVQSMRAQVLWFFGRWTAPSPAAPGNGEGGK